MRSASCWRKAKSGTDGIWPNEAVRDVLEEVSTKEIAVGMSIGLYNSRGVQWRGPGGQQERDLAAQYRDWSNTEFTISVSAT